MAGLNLQTGDHPGRFVQDSALVPAACHSLAGGSSNPPKFGTLIPNRIFVGGIPSNTTEQELKSFFSSFGQVKDVKIISDRLGVSKGSYGFVTFESQEMAEKIIKNESETLIFKDRKLNIGHAIRKQQLFPRPDLPTALFFAGGAVPYGFQNGMAVFSLPGQEYPVLTQAATPYATMMLPQPGGGTALYLSSALHSAASTGASPYAQLSQQQVTAALHQQHYHQQPGPAGGLVPTVPGQLTPVTVSSSNPQSNSTAAVMAAAAAAMAAAVQWPQQTPQSNGHQNSQQLTSATAHNVTQATAGPQTVVQNTSFTPQQAAAMAAAVAAQHQAAWRWSPTVQQPQPTHVSSPSHAPNSGALTPSSTAVGNTTSAPTLQNPQGSPTATLGPTTYLYSPITGTGQELMFFHQTSSPYATNSTSDYSTDHSTQSSGMLESVESLGFPCDATPIGRHSQQLSGLSGQQLDAACLSPYAAFAPLLDLQTHTAASGQQNAFIQSTTLQQQYRQPHHQGSAAVLTSAQPPSAPHIVPVAQKLYSPSLSSVSRAGQSTPNVNVCSLPQGIYGTPSVKVSALSELNSSSDLPVSSSVAQTSTIQTQNVNGGTPGVGSNNISQIQQTAAGSLNPVPTSCNGAIVGLSGESASSNGGHR
ncbi:unnamed protein product [Calicophoron daubneyi]|uniref:RRM domain-containing protein n=1 Tax=Calicophoron daubneyi TaxID=300641 RepID=A0AAV2TFF6_CALDB